ncbi:hybrid sensor histidine kinase/response regulator [Pseudorhodoferax sp. Leaf265]|jgi:signal transduction histidine kinase|uniref:hybrid sensor histidine kinase/response regulator n=1 Tax=Pseudorhodoferax sp. Leaf265 TaxID=1736315 RepID=UPI0006F96AE3|nr:hybrid sensor histidine kinase/response regulator [Pseudorhodoferax sp. Leaf265]KQP18750.1 two-component system sensor histidine kinase/response regulator [Pseudorhodoferax sp. Leaf265]
MNPPRPFAARDAQPAERPEPIKCLIVDDLDENLLALAALLQSEEVEVLQARSGTEALELLLRHEVALALVDVQMPEMDGFELAEMMRGMERTRHVPIIFVTAGTRDAQRMFRGYEAGAVDFLYKPVEPHVLCGKAGVFFQLYRQKQQLARNLQERTETLRLHELFTAVLGHDLRGPLSAITTAAELLLRRPDETTRTVAQRLLRSGQWMGRMIEDMLDLARTRQGGGMPMASERFDLGVLAERVVQERQSTRPDKQVLLDRQGNLQGDWDEDRLTQVLSNLVGNALRHGDEAPVQVELDGRHAAEVRLSVHNGGEIPADVLPHIFDPFRSGRAHAEEAPSRRTASRNEGLGLGLYIVREIVRAHGGQLQVESAAGRTRFGVTLPRAPQAAAAAPGLGTLP